MKLFGSFLLLSVILFFCIVSCGPVPFTSVTGGDVPISFHGETGSGSRSIESGEAVSLTRSTIASSSKVESWFNDYYTDLGTMVGSYTPSSYIMPLAYMRLESRTMPVELRDWSDPYDVEHIDFADSSMTTESVSIPASYYETLIFSIQSERLVDRRINAGATVDISSSGVSFTESIPDGEHIDIEVLGGGEYVFNLEYLLPDLSESHPAPLFDGSTGSIHFIYQTGLDGPTMYFSDNVGDMVDFQDITGHDFTTDSSSNPIIALPWDGLEIPGNVSEVEVGLTIDLNDIIEIYDPDGTLNNGDEIPVLANRFWEHFNIVCKYD